MHDNISYRSGKQRQFSSHYIHPVIIIERLIKCNLLLLFLLFNLFYLLSCFLYQVNEGRGKDRATWPYWLQDTFPCLLPDLSRIIGHGGPKDCLISSLVVSKMVIHMTNVWDNVVCARWEPGEIHLRPGGQLFILSHSLLQHDAAHCIDRLLPGLAIHQTSECLNLIQHLWLYRPINRFSAWNKIGTL